MNRKRWIFCIVYIILGACLTGLGIFGLVDGFWHGMGGGLLGVGIVQLIRQIRYNTNEEYKENFDTNAKDERNHFIAMKAWSWAGYLYVFFAAAGTIGFHLAGHNDLSLLCSGSVCLIVFLYWISYMVVKMKY